MAGAPKMPVPHGLFAALKDQPPDPLLALIGAFRDEARTDKIDLGVGMFRNEQGITPVMGAVKAAERLLVERQTTKGYLGPEGDLGFVARVKPIAFRAELAASERLVGVQTPGGTGAIRLGADLIAAAAPRAKVWVGLPSWPNYEPLFTAAKLQIETYQRFDVAAQRLMFDGVMSAIERARRGDVIVLQGCCHNPTGSDFSREQWSALAGALQARGLIPLLDFAYQGLGEGLEADAAGLRSVLQHMGEALIAYSCNKNFGLYRERTGALFSLAESGTAARTVFSNLLALARGNWSMPPDHGAAIVRTILESEDLSREWRAELDSMRARIASNRRRLAGADERFAALGRQRGMFSTIAIKPDTVERLKREHAIYMAGSGRINVAGFRGDDIERFVRALRGLDA